MMRGIAVLIFALLIGGGFGWLYDRSEEDAKISEDQMHRSWRDVSVADSATEDFVNAAKNRAAAQKKDGSNFSKAKLGDWSNAQIEAALNTSLTDPSSVVQLGSEVPGTLMGEWLKRDFNGAFAWFENLKSRVTQERFALLVENQWPAERAMEGLKFIIANQDMYRGALESLITKNMEVEGKKGPQAVADLLKFLDEYKLAREPVTFHLPDGFDFPGLVRALGGIDLANEGVGFELFKEWRRQDRDKAFQWFLEQKGDKSLKVLLMPSEDDYRENVNWLGGKLVDLPPAVRRDFLDSINTLNRAKNDSGEIESLILGIRDPEVLAEVRAVGLQAIFAGNTLGALRIIESINDPEERLKTLENLEPAPFFSKSAGRGFDTGNEAFFRGKLAEWNANQRRIDAIIKHLK